MKNSAELVLIKAEPQSGGGSAWLLDELDRIESLGADVLLLPEPYTAEDFCAVREEYGAPEDFKAFTHAAKVRGISVMIEFRVSDTSDTHIWYTKALEQDPLCRGYYFFRDGVAESTRRGETRLLPPNNWEGPDSREAWTQEQTSGQFCLSLMSPHRRDLDWSNPKLRADMAKSLRFWAELGVSAFYLPDANLIAKAEELPDCTPPKRGAYFPSEQVLALPEGMEYLAELRRKVQGRAQMVFAGSGAAVGAEAICRYTAGEGALDMMLCSRASTRDLPDVRDFKLALARMQQKVIEGGGRMTSAFSCGEVQYQYHSGFGGGASESDLWRAMALLDGTLAAAPCFRVPKGAPVEAEVRRLIKLRRDYPVFTQGDCRAFCMDNRQVLLFTREGGGAKILVAINLTDKQAKIDVTPTNVVNGVLIYGTHRVIGLEPVFNLLPFEGRIYLIK